MMCMTMAEAARPQRSRPELIQTKRKGSRNEHRSMAVLEAAGYRCTRAAGSLGEFDIIGIGGSDVVLCQVKSRDWPGSLERRILEKFPVPPNARKILHRWRDRQRLPEIQELT